MPIYDSFVFFTMLSKAKTSPNPRAFLNLPQCKNVISKLQRRIEKDGNQIVPFLSDWWRNEKLNFLPGASSNGVINLQTIEQRVDNLEYNGVMDFIADLQLMLKNIVRHCEYSYEV